jgi:hypothetical protein
MSPSDPITWSPEVTITTPAQAVPTFTQGRYISYELRSDDASVWVFTGIDMEVEFRGYF